MHAVVPRAQLLVADDAAAQELGAQERRRMRAQREVEETVVVDDFLAERHGRELHWRFVRDRSERLCGGGRDSDLIASGAKQRQVVVLVADAPESLRGPQRLATSEAE